MNKVTAIVSAYFAEQYLAGRIENLLHQKPQPEIIVVCQYRSPEWKITEDYSTTVVRVGTADIPTIYGAWNIGIKNASGEYLTNANSDDRLYPGALQYLASALDESPWLGVAYANADIVEEIGGPPVGRMDLMSGGFSELLERCFVGPMPMWRRSLHEEYGYFDAKMKSAGDYEFWLRLAKSEVLFGYGHRAIGAYLRRRNSAERREPLRTLWETARARSRYREEGVPV